jgi:uncharacterized alpha-E superfamily protein
MLSRVADSIYWMERYLERADNTARFIQVSKTRSLDFQTDESIWSSLIKASGSEDIYLKYYSEFSQENVIYFLAFDEMNPNSILCCLKYARENARCIRDIITGDMWEVVNSMFSLVINHASNTSVLNEASEFFHTLKIRRMTFMGLMVNTMLHQEAFHFALIGRHLERADMTSRILDVKYFTILPEYTEVGSAIDTIQWASLLESTDSLEMYIRQKGTISPKKVADFLILCQDFPRSIYYCLFEAQKSLHAISGIPAGSYQITSEKLIGKICSGMQYITINEIITTGLHEYLDYVQLKIARISKCLREEYLSPKIVKEEEVLLS